MNKNTKIFTLLVTVAVLVLTIGFVVDLHNTLVYPGSDLRNRVVGARLMLEGIDPYTFKWQPGWSEKFYDPLAVPTEQISKLSVPPTVLVLHAAIANLSYGQQKIIWLLVQWSALIGTVSIFIKTSHSQSKNVLTLAVGFFFASSLFWRLHVSSGQIYIVYVFLLAIAWLFLNDSSKYGHLISGFFAGVTVSLRPSFVLLFIPFLARRKHSFVLGGALGLLSNLALSWAVAGTLIWKRYVLVASKMIGLVDLDTYLSVAERKLPSPDIVYPKIVEAFSWSAQTPLERYFANTALYLPLNVLRVPNERGILLIGLMAATSCLLLCVLKHSPKSGKDTNFIFLFGVLMALVAEFFIPVPRYSYYDVQMILPLLVVINEAEVGYLVSRKINIALIAGLLLSVVGFVAVPRALFFSGLLIAFYAIAISISVVKQDSDAGSLKG